MEEKKNKHGGKRPGAGRKSKNGTRHTWTVPHDIERIVYFKGIDYVWESTRWKYAYDGSPVE